MAHVTKRGIGIGLAALGLAGWYVWRGLPRRQVQGKIVLITGGSRGLGLELARQFLMGGAKVALCARDENELARVKADLGKLGQVSIHAADISKKPEVERLVSEVAAQWGRIDLLVNNAAAFVAGPMPLMKLEDYRQMLEVNVLGTIAVTEACRPYIETRGGIITIASAAGIIPVKHLAPYAVSKAAVGMYAELLELEMAERGLQTMVVYPSYMPTSFPYHAEYRGEVAHEQDRLLKLTHTPLISASHQRGARLIYEAWRRGERRLVYPAAVKAGASLIGLVPQMVQRLTQGLSQKQTGK